MSPPPPDASSEEEHEPLVYGGRYVVQGKLGAGGMATVFRGVDRQLGRPVAIKVLRPGAPTAFEDDDEARMRLRFRTEAESLARLNHRYVVTLYDYGTTEGGENYLVMEYVSGGSLAGAVQNRQRMEPRRALLLASQIARALRYAHHRGIVHRDIKLANILLTRDDEGEHAKLVDFGLVKLMGDEGPTAHGVILGSIHSMAPEQISGGVIDQRVDLYGLGVVLFRLLTGRYPFEGSQNEQLAAHLHADVPRFRKVAPDVIVPDGVEEVVRKLLAKSPDDRYADADELLAALEPLMVAEVDPVELSASLHDATRITPPLPPPRAEGVPAGGTRRAWLFAAAALPVLALALFGAAAFGALFAYTLGPGAAGVDAPVVVAEPGPAPAPAPAPDAGTAPTPEPEPEPETAPDPRPTPRPKTRPKPAEPPPDFNLER